jgi:hypothetical protein
MDIRVKPTGTVEYRSGPNWIAIRPVRWFLRQAGHWHSAWHRFVQGVTLAGEMITLCLGRAARSDIVVWLRGHDGDVKARTHILCRALPRLLGSDRATRLAIAALRRA